MASRRADLLVGLAAAAVGAAATVAEDELGAAGLAAAVIAGGALGAARRHPRATWIVAVCALLASAPYAAPSFALALLAAAHAFCAGRHETRWAGLAALAALVGALELGVAIADTTERCPRC